MFFDITKEESPLLEEAFEFDGYKLYLDAGWQRVQTPTALEFRKGYSSEAELIDVKPGRNGNYCILRYSDHAMTIQHDDCRGFPLYYADEQVTNLYQKTPVWVDEKVVIEHGKIRVLYPDQPRCYHLQEKQEHTRIQNMVHDHLRYEMQMIEKYNGWFDILPSDGVDTCMLQAISKQPFTEDDYIVQDGVIWTAPTELSEYVQDIHWGYKQLSGLYNQIMTGFCGDEFMMRNPLYVHWYLSFYGIDLTKEYDYPSYMQGFIKHRYLHKLKPIEFESEQQMLDHIRQRMYNDHQMWHLNRVTTFTPLKNRFIPELLFTMKPEDVLAQVTDASLQKEIIKKAALSGISTHKNNVSP